MRRICDSGGSVKAENSPLSLLFDCLGMMLNVGIRQHLDLTDGAVPRLWRQHSAPLFFLGEG
jgi:hypothetical protein